MRTETILVMVLCLLFAAHAQERRSSLSPVPFQAVRLQDQFWSTRLRTNRVFTIPYAFSQCEATGRVKNFALASGRAQGEQSGIYPFDDSDLYKVIEGASSSMATHPDPRLDRYCDSLIALIAAAQEGDGYLYTARTNRAKRLFSWAGGERWSRLSGSHELYNLGHLYEAAAAHFTATGKRTLLDVALKSAALLLRDFGPGARHTPPGHQEVEIGLEKLYRLTGNADYVHLAKFFLDQRGRSDGGRTLWGAYAQDQAPVLEQDEALGHAVRLMYMLSAMADLAALTGEGAYGQAAERLWKNVVEKKMYLTGGIGANGLIEGFGKNYDLPNLSAYSETCSSIAFAMASHRLFLLTGDAQYLDVLERVLYNAMLSGISLDGQRFFYPNPLASLGGERSPWFDCACCPTNVARFLPLLPGYFYATRGENAYITLFASSTADLHLEGGRLHIEEQTDYPWSGAVSIRLRPESPFTFSLCIRVPGWARHHVVPGGLYRELSRDTAQLSLKVNGEAYPVKLERGFAVIERRWKRGDEVSLNLPMGVYRIVAHESVLADRGMVALERGPIIYCAEGVDFPDNHVLNLVLPDGAKLHARFESGLLDGVEVITGEALAVRQEGRILVSEREPFAAIPYALWAHRGSGEMTVWFGRTPQAVKPVGYSPLSLLKTVLSRGGEKADALHDGFDPGSSADSSAGYFRSSTDTVRAEYWFREPVEVSGTEVYWFEDGKVTSAPGSWRILVRADGKWQAAYAPEKRWGIEPDRFNRVRLEAVRSDALRLEAVARPGMKVGILEWRIF